MRPFMDFWPRRSVALRNVLSCAMSLVKCGFVMALTIANVCRNPKLKALIQGLPHLVAYADKIHDTYFPDYQKWS